MASMFTCSGMNHRRVEVEIETVFVLVAEIRDESTIILQTSSRHGP